jgi:hypothetical protein
MGFFPSGLLYEKACLWFVSNFNLIHLWSPLSEMNYCTPKGVQDYQYISILSCGVLPLEMDVEKVSEDASMFTKEFDAIESALKEWKR